MMLYRIENDDVVVRVSDTPIAGWKECTLDEQGQMILDAEAMDVQARKNERVLLTQYAQDRAAAYPSLEEQADMAYWDRLNGTTTLDDAIRAVKVMYPKPTTLEEGN